MKRVIFFDIDNTIFSHQTQSIPSQTIKLIKELSTQKETILALATGRGPSKLYIIEEVRELFPIKILINGSIAYNREELIFNEVLKKEVVLNIINHFSPNVSVGLVAKEKEVLHNLTKEAEYNLKGYAGFEELEVDSTYHLENDVYQVWVFDQNRKNIEEFAKTQMNMRYYHWHAGGSDYVGKNTNKANAIKKVMEQYPGYQIITVGDGQNDIEMVSMADIGIAMSNAGSDKLKTCADFIAPHIDENKLYDFFKENKLI